MDFQQELKKYRARLALEGWLHSLLLGFAFGLSANVVCSLLFFVFGVKQFWISIALLFAVAAIATPLLYFFRYRSDNRKVASRVDTFGLEERILTMTQFADDDSYIARRQREDAMAALKTVNAKLIRIMVSVPLAVTCAVLLVAGAGATTVSAVADESLLAIIRTNAEEKKENVFYDVEYEVKDDVGGIVEGETFQTVQSGCDSAPVQAVAEDGYIFIGWSDGRDEDLRSDVNVRGAIKVYAIFVESEDGNGNDDLDQDSEFVPGSKGSYGRGFGQPDDKKDPPEGSGDENGGGEGGSFLPNNQVVDGSTFYGDMYEGSLGDVKDSMSSNGNLTGGESDVIGNYFSGIKR